MGPRKTGKTTLVTQLVDDFNRPYHFVSADAVAATNTTWLGQQWETARLKMEGAHASEFLLVVDKIRKIHNWRETAKALRDSDSRAKRNLKVILLGSSRFLLRIK